MTISGRLIDNMRFCERQIEELTNLDLAPVHGGASRENLAAARDRSLKIFKNRLSEYREAYGRWMRMGGPMLDDVIKVL